MPAELCCGPPFSGLNLKSNLPIKVPSLSKLQILQKKGDSTSHRKSKLNISSLSVLFSEFLFTISFLNSPSLSAKFPVTLLSPTRLIKNQDETTKAIINKTNTTIHPSFMKNQVICFT